MTATIHRHRPMTAPLRHATFPTDLGDLLAVADGDALTGLYFEHHRYPPSADRCGVRVDAVADELLASVETQVGEYLAGARRGFDLPLAPSGEPFQHRVWALLTGIPHGSTTTYGALATDLGDRNLAQAVGGAVGRNPISIIVPCHRVVGADGSLTGYAGGLDRKRALLDLEAGPPEASGRLF